MKHPRLSPAELAAERRLRLRAWVLLSLPAEEIGAILQSSMPPTIAGLIAHVRKRVEETAARCAHCGGVLPVDLAAVPKTPRIPNVLTAPRARAKEFT
jgi:hypothetical protein